MSNLLGFAYWFLVRRCSRPRSNSRTTHRRGGSVRGSRCVRADRHPACPILAQMHREKAARRCCFTERTRRCHAVFVWTTRCTSPVRRSASTAGPVDARHRRQSEPVHRRSTIATRLFVYGRRTVSVMPSGQDASTHHREDQNYCEHGPAEGKPQDSRGGDAVHETAACPLVGRGQSRQVAGRAVSIGYASQNRLRKSVQSSLLCTSVG